MSVYTLLRADDPDAAAAAGLPQRATVAELLRAALASGLAVHVTHDAVAVLQLAEESDPTFGEFRVVVHYDPA